MLSPQFLVTLWYSLAYGNQLTSSTTEYYYYYSVAFPFTYRGMVPPDNIVALLKDNNVVVAELSGVPVSVKSSGTSTLTTTVTFDFVDDSASSYSGNKVEVWVQRNGVLLYKVGEDYVNFSKSSDSLLLVSYTLTVDENLSADLVPIITYLVLYLTMPSKYATKLSTYLSPPLSTLFSAWYPYGYSGINYMSVEGLSQNFSISYVRVSVDHVDVVFNVQLSSSLSSPVVYAHSESLLLVYRGAGRLYISAGTTVSDVNIATRLMAAQLNAILPPSPYPYPVAFRVALS